VPVFVNVGWCSSFFRATVATRGQSSLDLPFLTHGRGLSFAQDYSAYCLVGSLFLLHRGARHWWGECASEWSYCRVCVPFSSLVVLTMGLVIAYGSCRTATHHNMMLDPAVLCASSRFVIIALITLIDIMQHRRFLICAYCTIGVKVRPPTSVSSVMTF
jgi:hypothetical protein